MMSKIKATAIAGMFMLVAALTASAQQLNTNEVYIGGSFDGWDALATTNVFCLGDTKISFSSGANQQFDFTQISKELLTCVITAEDPGGQIVAGHAIRLCAPAGWRCSFDNTAAASFEGNAASKVGTAVYEDAGKTLSIPVTHNFATGDVLRVSGLRLVDCRFAGPETVKALELDFDGDGTTDLYDEFNLIVAFDWIGGSYDGWCEFATVLPVFLGASGTIITLTQLFGAWPL